MKRYILRVKSDHIDAVLRKLFNIETVEINNVVRAIGSITVKASSLDAISSINEILVIEKEKSFYFESVKIM